MIAPLFHFDTHSAGGVRGPRTRGDGTAQLDCITEPQGMRRLAGAKSRESASDRGGVDAGG